jgi:hypothetical protein
MTEKPMSEQGIDPNYSKALDEIFRMRREAAASAYFVLLVLDQTPKGSLTALRRTILQDEADRLRGLARGEARSVEAEREATYADYTEFMSDAGAPHALTRAQWEAEAR